MPNKQAPKVTATAEQIGNAELSAAPLSSATGETGRQEIDALDNAKDKKEELQDMQLGGDTMSEAQLQERGVKNEGDLTQEQLQSGRTPSVGSRLDAGKSLQGVGDGQQNVLATGDASTVDKPGQSDPIETDPDIGYTALHVPTFLSLKADVQKALEQAGDNASDLLKRVDNFFDSLHQVQPDLITTNTSESMQLDSNDKYLVQAFRELFNISGKEVGLRINMMNRAIRRADQLSAAAEQA